MDEATDERYENGLDSVLVRHTPVLEGLNPSALRLSCPVLPFFLFSFLPFSFFFLFAFARYAYRDDQTVTVTRVPFGTDYDLLLWFASQRDNAGVSVRLRSAQAPIIGDVVKVRPTGGFTW